MLFTRRQLCCCMHFCHLAFRFSTQCHKVSYIYRLSIDIDYRYRLSWRLYLEVQQRNRTSCVFLHKLPVCVTVLQWANHYCQIRYVSTLNLSLGARTVSGAGPIKNVIRKLRLEARRQLSIYCESLAIVWAFDSYSNKNLSIANRSRVSCAHNTLRASIGLNITPWPWNLRQGSLKVTRNETIG